MAADRVDEALKENDGVVVDDPEKHRFELTVGGQTAFLVYERRADRFTIIHTDVPVAFRGRNFGGRLVEAAVASAHTAGLPLVVVCPFARAYLSRHPR